MIHHRSPAFSLIELLVVVSVIALVIALLLPSLGRAKEASRRAVCGSNLRQWGLINHNFLQDRKQFWVTYRRLNTGLRMDLWRWKGNAGSPYLSDSPAYENSEEWRSYGTSYIMLERYGANESLRLCPSETWRNASLPLFGMPDTSWGNVYRPSYLYLVNIRTPYPGWSTLISDTRTQIVEHHRDPNLSGRVMLADMMATFDPYWSLFNHEGKFQNLLFGDGHVGSRSYSPSPNLATDLSAQGDSNGYQSYSYWEGNK